MASKNHTRSCLYITKGYLRVVAIVVLYIYGVSSEKVRAALLPYECSPKLEKGECRWSNWTKNCFWPREDNELHLKSLTEELADQGCKVPQSRFGRLVLRRRMELVYSTTVIKRLQETPKPCGGCSFRLRCCKESSNFLNQSIDASQCIRGTFAKACIVPALTAVELQLNRLKHPDWPHTSDDMCDFNQFIPLHRIPGNDTSNRLLQRLLCSFYGNSQPIITCTKISNFRCQCCCNGFVPSTDGFCIPDPTPRPDSLCLRNEPLHSVCPSRDIGI